MQSTSSSTVPPVLHQFAKALGTTVTGNRVIIPAGMGEGYCAGFVFEPFLRILILHFSLHAGTAINNPDLHMEGKILLFKFQHIFRGVPTVLMATSNMNAIPEILVDRHTASLNIEISSDYVSELIGTSKKSASLQRLLENEQPLFFEQMIPPGACKALDEIINEQVAETFEPFFRRAKAEELLCRLLMELEKRQEQQVYALNRQDVEAIYALKEKLLSRLDSPPLISTLAIHANMSPSKLKRLFKQIFGCSIFTYYQEHRMREAARLLKDERLPVAAVGYQLGFSNLGHFARVFKRHAGMNPKQSQK